MESGGREAAARFSVTDPSYSQRRVAAFLSLGLSSLFAVALVLTRVVYTGKDEGLNLVWNLVLAWIPFVVAIVVYDASRRGASRPFLFAGAALWLLFLPNAPYLVTDFKLLEEWASAPVWFDVVVVSAAAWTGLALGFVSLYLMQAVARRLLGVLSSWILALAVLALSSFGIYLGRFERWNSWDIFIRPTSLLSDIADRLANPLEHGRALAVTALFTVFLTLAYGVFYSLTRLRLSELEEL